MYKYEHGGDIYQKRFLSGGKRVVDYSANLNPLGLPVAVKKAVVKALKDCENYPDPFCRDLSAAIGDKFGLPKEYVFCGNGAADVLFRLALAVKPKRALLLAPTFADYEKALLTVHTEIVYYPLTEANAFAVQEDILNKVDESIDFIVICNPNNPTGMLTKRDLLLRLLQKAEACKAYVLVDECFMDFVAEPEAYTLLQQLVGYKNLIILKAFTKTYAMPGLRLGYCLTANADIIDSLREHGQDWSVSTVAQAAGLAALQETEYVLAGKSLVAKERQYLHASLSKLGIRVFNGAANYLLLKIDCIDFAERLAVKGFLVRKCANYHQLNAEFFRIAVKRHSTNVRLIKAIKEVLADAVINGNN